MNKQAKEDLLVIVEAIVFMIILYFLIRGLLV